MQNCNNMKRLTIKLQKQKQKKKNIFIIKNLINKSKKLTNFSEKRL